MEAAGTSSHGPEPHARGRCHGLPPCRAPGIWHPGARRQPPRNGRGPTSRGMVGRRQRAPVVLSAARNQATSPSRLLLLRSLLGGWMLVARPVGWRREPAERAKHRISPRHDGGWNRVPRWWRLGGDGLQFPATPATEDPRHGDGGAPRGVTAAEETDHPLHGGSLRANQDRRWRLEARETGQGHRAGPCGRDAEK